jgi:hypothetical protein
VFMVFGLIVLISSRWSINSNMVGERQ